MGDDMDRDFCQNVCKNVIENEEGDLRCAYYEMEAREGLHDDKYISEESVVAFEKEYLPKQCPYKLEATVLDANKEQKEQNEAK